MSRSVKAEISKTKGKLIEYKHLWEIENFSHCLFTSNKLTSPPFIVEGYGDDKRRLELTHVEDYINDGRNRPRWKDHFSLFLILDGEPKPFSIKLNFFLLNAARNSVYTHFTEHEIHGPLQTVLGHEEFIRKQEYIEKKEVLLPNDVLRVACIMSIMTGMETIKSKKKSVKFDTPKCTLADDMELLFNDPTTGDVTLTVGTKKLYAHKLILSTRSSVFAGMFRNKMKENIEKTVDIKDVDAELFEEVLHFIYTDKVSDLKGKAIELLACADMYDLKTLKAMCEETLFTTVNVESAAEVLVLADRHHADQLKTHVLSFIKSHMTDVVKTEGFKEMERNHVHLIVEAFKAIAISSGS